MAVLIVTVATGMAYSLLWISVVRHQRSAWLIPGDIWGTVRDAHYVSWGALPYIYQSQTELVTLPGLPILLAPVVALSKVLGLTESFGPWVVLHPSAWLLDGPVLLALGSAPLFAVDAWLEDLGIASWRRVAAVLGAAAVVWDMTARWGHPEDAVALAGALYCLLAIRRRRFRQAAWVLGVAACFQPLVILVVPVVAAVAGWRRLGPLALRAGLLPACLAVAVLARDAHDALRAFIEQPNFPLIDQPTPWARLSPALANHTIGAGPARLVALAVACGLGWWAWRWRADWHRLLWLAACMLATRGVFEAVMVPYYVAPALALLVLSAWATLPAWRALLTTAAAMGAVVLVNHKGTPWTWWLESVGLLLGALLVACPLLPGRRPGGGTLDGPVDEVVSSEDLVVDLVVPRTVPVEPAGAR